MYGTALKSELASIPNIRTVYLDACNGEAHSL
jgi:hypothetical protein